MLPLGTAGRQSDAAMLPSAESGKPFTLVSSDGKGSQAKCKSHESIARDTIDTCVLDQTELKNWNRTGRGRA